MKRPFSSRLTAAVWLVACGVPLACTGSIDGTGNNPGAGASGNSTGAGAPGSSGTGATGNPGGSGNLGTGGTGVVGAGGTGIGTSGATGSGGTVAPGTARPLELTGHPKFYRFIRLTNEQYGNSVKDLLKLPAPPSQVNSFLPTVSGATDFNNNELLLDVTSRFWSDYQAAAEAIATQASASDAALKQFYSGAQDAATFIQTFGRRGYRRPLTSTEVSNYQKVFTTGSQSAFTKGAGLVIEAMLQSPFFLYRSEMAAAGAALSSYEIAAKLSLLLRDTTPSDELLDAAAGPGGYDTVDGAVALTTKLLEEPTAKATMRKFHDGFLDIDTYGQISKVNTPSYKESLNAELAESAYLFFDKLFQQNLGLREMLLTTSGFVGRDLAPLYGVAAPASGFAEVDLGAKRVGFFEQIPFLARYGINDEADPIHRGVQVGVDVLCANPGDAAPNLPPVPPLQPNQTNRERYEGLTGGCGGECHNVFINPIGFSFENFDGMGQWREMQNSKPINAAGSYPFTEGAKSFNNAADLMKVMADGEQVHLCYGKKLAGFAMQRELVESDRPLVTSLKTASMAQGGSIKKIFIELVKNPAFRTRIGGAP